MLDSILPGEGTLTWLVTLFSFIAVGVPFLKGFKVGLQGWGATRAVSISELKKGTTESGKGAALSLLMMRVLRKSLQENEQDHHPVDFIFDASRQYVMNEFEHHYSRMISMFSSLLPPLGFIGTTGGMFILFVSMHLGEGSLELGALAVALTSSIFALMGYAILEGMKIRLYGRLLDSLSEVETLFHEADARRKLKEDVGSDMGPGAR